MSLGGCSDPATAGSEVDSRMPKMVWLDLAGGCSYVCMLNATKRWAMDFQKTSV